MQSLLLTSQLVFPFLFVFFCHFLGIPSERIIRIDSMETMPRGQPCEMKKQEEQQPQQQDAAEEERRREARKPEAL